MGTTKEAIANRWRNLNYINITSKRGVNMVKIATNKSMEHEIMKLVVCYCLRIKGHDFITEAEFNNNKGIADVVDLDEGQIWEVAISENDKSLLDKAEKYPMQIHNLRFKAEQVMPKGANLDFLVGEVKKIIGVIV